MGAASMSQVQDGPLSSETKSIKAKDDHQETTSEMLKRVVTEQQERLKEQQRLFEDHSNRIAKLEEDNAQLKDEVQNLKGLLQEYASNSLPGVLKKLPRLWHVEQEHYEIDEVESVRELMKTCLRVNPLPW